MNQNTREITRAVEQLKKAIRSLKALDPEDRGLVFAIAKQELLIEQLEAGFDKTFEELDKFIYEAIN
jgi:hypothetical protein